MMIANLCFWGATFFCKLALVGNTHLNGFDYMIPRGIALLATSFWDVIISKINIFNVNRSGLKLLITRSFIGAVGMPWYFIALKYLPMSQASIIANFAPLIVPVLAYFALDEKLGFTNIIPLITGFGGCVLISITKPHNSTHKTFNDMYYIGIVLCVVALLARSLVPVTLRLLSTHLHPIYAPVYFSVGVFLSGMVCLIVSPSSFNFGFWTKREIFLFFISGIWNYGEQRFVTIAMKYGKASILVSLTYLNIALMLVIDLVYFKYEFEMIYFIGFIVIIASVLTPIAVKAI